MKYNKDIKVQIKSLKKAQKKQNQQSKIEGKCEKHRKKLVRLAKKLDKLQAV